MRRASLRAKVLRPQTKKRMRMSQLAPLPATSCMYVLVTDNARPRTTSGGSTMRSWLKVWWRLPGERPRAGLLREDEKRELALIASSSSSEDESNPGRERPGRRIMRSSSSSGSKAERSSLCALAVMGTVTGCGRIFSRAMLAWASSRLCARRACWPRKPADMSRGGDRTRACQSRAHVTGRRREAGCWEGVEM
jgi:hypothetical protein